MGEQVVKSVFCDVDGEGVPAVATHRFTLDGTSYVIDLSEGRDGEFLESFEFWLPYARPDLKGPKAGAKRKTAAKSSNGEVSAIRAWAKANGYDTVGDRGRISTEIRDAYEAQNGAGASEDDEAVDVDAEDAVGV
jgi:Lsr2